jgi:hypothetical protein
MTEPGIRRLFVILFGVLAVVVVILRVWRGMGHR